MRHGWTAFVRCSRSHTVAVLVDDRRVLGGIIFIIRNVLRWCDAPAAHGPHKRLYNRFVRWSEKGIFSQIFEEPARPSDQAQEVLTIVGWRRIDVENNYVACTWAEGVRRLAEEDFSGTKRITLVMDNLSTHCGASLYKAFGELSRAAFEPEVARRLLDRLEFVYTPKQGSWLNRSECEFSVLLRQCLHRRLPDIDRVRSELNAWVDVRNGVGNTTKWRFTTKDARIKLRSLYLAKLN